MKPLIKSDLVIIKFLEIIKNFNIPIHSVYLFGSRANGKSKESSDYDFLLLLDPVEDIQELKNFKLQLNLEVHKKITKKDFDILVRSFKDFEINKDKINTLYNHVYEDGLILYEQ
jgi:predicted nucleotidyltransferase